MKVEACAKCGGGGILEVRGGCSPMPCDSCNGRGFLLDGAAAVPVPVDDVALQAMLHMEHKHGQSRGHENSLAAMGVFAIDEAGRFAFVMRDRFPHFNRARVRDEMIRALGAEFYRTMGLELVPADSKGGTRS